MPTSSSPLFCIGQAYEVPWLTYSEIASALSAEESTVHRWRSGGKRASPVFRARLATLDDLLAALRSAFGSSAAGWLHAQTWLDTPHALYSCQPTSEKSRYSTFEIPHPRRSGQSSVGIGVAAGRRSPARRFSFRRYDSPLILIVVA